LIENVRLVADEKTRVVVVGAGFGGLAFCKHFHSADARITLVDRANYHLFQPLYQVAACGLFAPSIAHLKLSRAPGGRHPVLAMRNRSWRPHSSV
jgi:NADH dehydrogenase FAD-containing subunit